MVNPNEIPSVELPSLPSIDVTLSESADFNGGDSSKDIKVGGITAEDLIIEYERRQNRKAEKIPDQHEAGYDIYSVSIENPSDIRRIEVKSFTGPASIPELRPSQAKISERYGEEYYLYVVEYRDFPDIRKVYKIKNPLINCKTKHDIRIVEHIKILDWRSQAEDDKL